MSHSWQDSEFLQLVLDSTAEGIYGMDPEGKCTLCNAAGLRMLGYQEPSELLGRGVHALMHHTRFDGSPYPLEECRIFQAFHRGEKCHADDEVFWRADGTSFPVEYWSYPVVRDQQIIGAVVAFIDITQRRRSEQWTYLLGRAVESATDMIGIGDVNSRITYVNRAILNTLGYREEEILGRDLTTLLSPQNSPKTIEEIAKAGVSPNGWRGECVMRRRDGTELPLFLSRNPIHGAVSMGRRNTRSRSQVQGFQGLRIIASPRAKKRRPV